MSGALHLAILRCAAMLVPGAQRAEWLAEWRSEACYVGEERVTAFCLGAFRDAFWLWRDDAGPERQMFTANSPGRCLWTLAALGALCIGAAFCLPAARSVLLCSLYPRDLAMVMPARGADVYSANGFLDPYPSVALNQFEWMKENSGGEFAELTFYVPQRLSMDTPGGKRVLSVVRTSAALFRLLNIPVERRNVGTTGLVLSSSAWRRYFGGDARGVMGVVSDDRWNLPGKVDGWLIEDDAAIAKLPASTKGFVVGRLRQDVTGKRAFRFLRLRDRSFDLLIMVTPMFLIACAVVALVKSGSRGVRPRRIEVRSFLFFAAKLLLVSPIVVFGSLDVGSLTGSVSPLFLDGALFGSAVAAWWILSDQRKRCPVCLRLLANPVRIGETSRILLEWHGTELMCVRGHGLLYVPEWPAIWSSRQRWVELGPSWGPLFP
jgi:hypothetical protein